MPTDVGARDARGMNTSLRMVLDIALRSFVLVAASQVVAELYARANPDDDGLGTGLTVMALMVALAGAWGLVDGFRRPLAHLCVTWIVVGLVTSAVTTVYAGTQEQGPVDWSVVVADLQGGLLFWAALVFVPAVLAGALASLARGQGPAEAHPSDR
jgi:predicted membrane channel-forming protein YqfA (hemolysin III family)